MNFYVLEPVMWLLFFIIIFYSYGGLLTKNLLDEISWPENFFINVVLGFGCGIVILLIMATFHLLTKMMIVSVFSIGPLVYFYQNLQLQSSQFRIKTFYKGIIAHAGLLFFIMYWLLPEAFRIFFPDIRSDAMRYHLPYAKFYAAHQGLAVNEYLRYPLFSHNADLVYSLGYIFQKGGQAEVLARLFHFFSFSLLCFGLYALIARNFNKLMAVLACFILINTKLVHIYSVSGYIDFALGLFVFASIYFIDRWQKDNNNTWLIFSAAMLGLALGTKYLALIWLIPMVVWVYVTNKNWKHSLHFLLVSLLIGSFWYIRNIIIAGNPIHPFAQNVFGYWLWTPQDLIKQQAELLSRPGVDKTILNLIKLPWILLTDKNFSYDKLGWLAMGIPFTLFAFKMQKYFKIMAVFLLVNIVIWFYSSQIARYLFSMLPLLAIFASYPFSLLYDKILQLRIFNNEYLIQTVAIVLILFSANDLLKTYISWNKWNPIPDSNIAWQFALSKTNKEYAFTKILNERHAKSVLKLGKAELQYTFEGQVKGDWFGTVNMLTVAQQIHSSKDLIKIMKSINTQYVFINKEITFFSKIYALVKNSNDFKILKISEDFILCQLNSGPT